MTWKMYTALALLVAHVSVAEATHPQRGGDESSCP